MKHLISKHNLSDQLFCESAGTSGYHVGELPDDRMRAHAAQRGITLDSPARRFTFQDFIDFDYIVTMDRSNYINVCSLDIKKEYQDKVLPMAKLCHEHDITDVPDPYYGGPDGFEVVLDIVNDGCHGLLYRLDLIKPKF